MIRCLVLVVACAAAAWAKKDDSTLASAQFRWSTEGWNGTTKSGDSWPVEGENWRIPTPPPLPYLSLPTRLATEVILRRVPWSPSHILASSGAGMMQFSVPAHPFDSPSRLPPRAKSPPPPPLNLPLPFPPCPQSFTPPIPPRRPRPAQGVRR